jgi:hypothetical protein
MFTLGNAVRWRGKSPDGWLPVVRAALQTRSQVDLLRAWLVVALGGEHSNDDAPTRCMR